jgi:hypothetical protein
MKSVPRNDVRASPFVWTRGTAARETLRNLDRNGIDAEPLLVKGELSFRVPVPGVRRDPDERSAAGLHVAAETDPARLWHPLLPWSLVRKGRRSARTLR